MDIDRLVLVFAGAFVLASLALARIHDERRLWFTAFVGANLAQAGVTRFCPLAKILRLLGVKSGCAFDCGAGPSTGTRAG